MSAPNASFAWAEALVAELARSGVRDAVLSPGSRCAPLALAFAAHPGVRDRPVLDERSAAFFALGVARGRRAPVAIVCTSGSAAANLLPALVEAHHARVPLIALTADRPPEQRDCGAGQTIDQLKLFGGHVRFFADAPPPSLDAVLLRHLRALACRAVLEAGGPPAGPVHLNLPFREPLAPVASADDRRALRALPALARDGRAPGPFTRTAAARSAPGPAVVERLAEWMSGERRGWLVAGPIDAGPALAQALARLARACGWPLLADALSPVRCGDHDRDRLVDAHDAVLRAGAFVDAHRPRAVLRFGAMPTSKAFRERLESQPEVAQVVVAADGWPEPTLLAQELVRADPTGLATALAERLEARGAPAGPSRFAAAWVRAGRASRALLDAELARLDALSEPGAVRALAAALPDGATLFAANSLPVREVDAFWPAGDARVRCVASRGANGIDGTLSTALGLAAASPGPCAALVGDLALLHDWTGVLCARGGDIDATVVVLDNDGGGIFELLPIARHASRASFERLFATPQSVDIGAALRGFGIPCADPGDVAELRSSLARALAAPGVQFVRVRSDRRGNAELHRKLFDTVAAALPAAAP